MTSVEVSNKANRPNEPAPVLTIDGPSGAGKGAASASVAETLGWHLLDSGAVYRSVAVAALDRAIAVDDEAGLVRLSMDLDLAFQSGSDGIEVLLDGRSVDERLRSEEVSVASSRVAALPAVREALLDLQRSFRRWPGLVADGRDMGTIVFADAPVKVFLHASVQERANRRYKQLKDKGESVIFSRLFRDLEERDRRDRERAVAPTVPAADAVVIDSTSMPLAAVVGQILSIVRKRLEKDAGKEQQHPG